ncbi:exosome complex component Rrp4 [Nanobdella aerobiophila]|uniref:Exosome complex component Rrp4 n=1 Tax=Nanobdella aerobiophila TaxID=2586965 RepID=A0A915T0B0_9ARCH|nr:hypothetical protein [Nanobdella aerobiophila]BBL45859.1 exosome complex component Rrp4 [Nanobdella aerobiophila]
MILLPGDKLNNKNIYSYDINDEFFSKYILLSNDNIKYNKIFGYYIPKIGDVVISKVIDVLSNGWLLDINSPYLGFLQLKNVVQKDIDHNKIYTYGDYILTEITKITKNMMINLNLKNRKKLNNGLIISIDPIKLPRLIGKNSSMINMIKEKLNIKIITGKNGRLYLSGDYANIIKAYNVIKFIMKNSYKKGLTEKINEII